LYPLGEIASTKKAKAQVLQEGVNAFKLVMDDRHIGERVPVAQTVLVDETFQIALQGNDPGNLS
jgi:hypothetical protein